MFNNTNNRSGYDLLVSLQQKGYVTSNTFKLTAADLQENTMPWYLQAVIAIGTSITCLALGLLVMALGIIDHEHYISYVLAGLALIAIGLFLQRAVSNAPPLQQTFFLQCSLASLILGKGLFVSGGMDLAEFDMATTISFLAITVVTYPLSKSFFERSLSVFATFVAFPFDLLNGFYFDGNPMIASVLLNVFFVFVSVLVALLSFKERLQEKYKDIFYAAVFALCVLIYFFTADIRPETKSIVIDAVLVKVILVAGLVALIGNIAGNFRVLQRPPLLLASIGIAVLGVFTTPAILLGLGLMILGYARHLRLITVAGIGFLTVSISAYYYNLDTSLLTKSIVLAGSGALILMGRFLMMKKGWDGATCV